MLFFVIQKVSNSIGGTNRLIVNSALPRRFKTFDAWPTHAFGSCVPSYIQAASLLYYARLSGSTIDGTKWLWINDTPLTLDQANSFLFLVYSYQVYGHPGDWVGEGFNRMMRAGLNVKVQDNGIEDVAWLNSH
jgi:hypothetical protein